MLKISSTNQKRKKKDELKNLFPYNNLNKSKKLATLFHIKKQRDAHSSVNTLHKQTPHLLSNSSDLQKPG